MAAGAGEGARLRPAFTLDELRRWEDHGATWRVIELDQRRAILELCTCFGEPVETVLGLDPALIAYVRRHRDD